MSALPMTDDRRHRRAKRDWDPKGPRMFHGTVDRPHRLEIAEMRDDILSIAADQGAWWACLQRGWQRDELEQEVLARVIARQSMPSRYDPARAGPTKYLLLLTRGILRNLLEQTYTQRRQRERLGVVCDAAQFEREEQHEEEVEECDQVEGAPGPDPCRPARAGRVRFFRGKLPVRSG